MDRKSGFTLIELLVVIAIIAILAAILFPVFAQAKTAAKKVSNTSNLRQISMGIMMYATDNDGYPMSSSPSTFNPRTRWPDYIFGYVKSEAMFNGPLAPEEMFNKKWAHNQALTYGGYGYNYQYLGNSRTVAGNPNFPFAASESMIEYPAETIAVADTQGVRRDNNSVGGGEYTIDPPVTSARGSGKASGFYGEGAECGSGAPGTPGEWGCRSTPAEWNVKLVTIAWADGHAKPMRRSRLDDYNKDGQKDNGFWNGKANADQF